MKKILGLIILTGCVTAKPKDVDTIIQVGDAARLLQGAKIDLIEDDWKGQKEWCVTHVYRCQINKDGSVQNLQALDTSSPLFQAMTEESMREWRFEPGTAKSCFAEFIYEKNQPTRILLLPENIANELRNNLQANRASIQIDADKEWAKLISEEKIPIPKEMAIRGQSGFITLLYDLDDEGHPRNIRVVSEQPQGAWEKSTLASFRRWRYASLKEQPESRRKGYIELTFQMDGSPRISSCDIGISRNRLAEPAAIN